MPAHIFVDNSNMYGGAQRAAETLEPDALRFAVRVQYDNFFRLIERDHVVGTRVLGGSVPPGNEALWGYARAAGYDTSLLRRVSADDGRLVEQGVDEVLHGKIADALLDFDPPQTLVLATGDGRLSEFGGSFEAQVQRALRRGWHVEVWSWAAQLSGRFGRIPVPAGLSVQVRQLDPNYWSITFVQSGIYRVGGAQVTLAGRRARPLPAPDRSRLHV